MYDLLQSFFGYFFTNCLHFYSCEGSNYYIKNSMELNQFSSRNFYFQKVSSAFEKAFQIPALFKECNACTSHGYKNSRKHPIHGNTKYELVF